MVLFYDVIEVFRVADDNGRFVDADDFALE